MNVRISAIVGEQFIIYQYFLYTYNNIILFICITLDEQDLKIKELKSKTYV